MTAVAICLAIVTIAMASAPACIHWFIIPVFACGLVCCSDGLLLFSKKNRILFQPVPLLGAFGVYFFFIAPIMHVATDYWFTSEAWAPKDVPEDWRTWLGLMAVVNFVGLSAYKILYPQFTRVFLKRHSSVFPKIDVRAIRSYGLVVPVIAFLLQTYVYYLFGGIGGFIQAFRSSGNGGASDFNGLGWLFTLAESFPVLFVIVCSVLFKRHLERIGPLRLLAYVCATFLLALLFGGLRGSRGNTVYTIAYIIGIIHLTVRPISGKLLTVCGLALLPFMYIYGFYKSNPVLFSDPTSFIDTVASSDSRDHLEKTTGRSVEGVLMGDLDRSDLQAYLLFRMLQQGSDVKLAYGRTYLEGALSFIPYGLFQYRPPGKLKYGTNAVFGGDTYSDVRFSTKIYGLAGETMLNFGVYCAPFGFVLLAAAVGYVRALISRLSTSSDSRWYFVPIISIACITFLSSDLDNVLFVLSQHALVPFILIRMCSHRALCSGGARQGPLLRSWADAQ